MTRRISITFLLLFTTIAAAAHADERLSYVWSRNGSMTILNGTDLENFKSLRARYADPFLWFALDGREYMIRDRATLDEIARLFAPVDAIRPQYESLRRRMEPLEKEEEELDRKIDRLEDKLDRLEDDDAPESEQRAVERELRAVERDQRNLESRMRVLEEEEERIDARQDAAEREAERQMLPLLRKAIRDGRATRV